MLLFPRYFSHYPLLASFKQLSGSAFRLAPKCLAISLRTFTFTLNFFLCKVINPCAECFTIQNHISPFL